MAIATTTIGSRVGLHARPAALFARAAADLPVDVTIALGDGRTRRCLQHVVCHDSRCSIRGFGDLAC